MQSSSQRRMAKKKKQLVIAGKGSKGDYFDVYGEEAKAEAIWKVPDSRPTLKLEDFQGLISWILADGMNPSWIFIKNKPLVSKVVLLFIPGLDAALYISQLRLLQNLKICCGTPQAVMAISPITTPSQTMEVLLTCPVRKRKEMENSNVMEVKVAKPADPHKTRSQDAVHGEVFVSEEEGSTRCSKRAKQSRNVDLDRKGSTDDLLADQCSVLSQKAGATGLQATYPLMHYILTAREMQDNGYPTAEVSSDGCSVQVPEGYVMTQPGSGSSDLDMVAMDCEMCITAAGLELTRISLVNRDGKVLLDSLVKPANLITNYNTRYSGITAKMMEGVTTTLQEIRVIYSVGHEIYYGKVSENCHRNNNVLFFLKRFRYFPNKEPAEDKVLEIITAETTIVGHSLESDLTALKLVHMKVIDTALLYQNSTSSSHFKPALRVLAHRYLERKIQDSSEGHDSVEDARAAMDLTMLRIQKGPLADNNGKGNRDNYLSILSKQGRRCSVLDSKPVVHRYAAGSCHAIVCHSDDDVLVKATKEVKKSDVDFVWAQFTEVNAYLDRRAKTSNEHAGYMAEVAALKTCMKSDSESCQIMDMPISPELEVVLKQLDDRIQTFHEALPSNTMLIVLTGLGDTASVRRVQLELWKKKKNPSEVLAQPWLECSDLLEELESRAATALGFVTIKV